jgi:hypothetical protein
MCLSAVKFFFGAIFKTKRPKKQKKFSGNFQNEKGIKLSTSKEIKVGDLVRWGWPRFHNDHRVGIVTQVDIRPKGAGWRVAHPKVRYIVQWFNEDAGPCAVLDHVFDNEITRVKDMNPWDKKTKSTRAFM